MQSFKGLNGTIILRNSCVAIVRVRSARPQKIKQ